MRWSLHDHTNGQDTLPPSPLSHCPLALVTITYYSLAIVVVSVLGGMLPGWLRLTHRWTECAVSFVAGVMLGVALMHLLPHALDAGNKTPGPNGYLPSLQWVLGGFLAMFFVERFFCFHHHDVPSDTSAEAKDQASTSAGVEGFVCCDHDHPHSDHAHEISWSGAAVGLTLHSVMAGVALAASVQHGSNQLVGIVPAGFGTFLAILLHKPFDSMTIAMLMARGGWGQAAQAWVNAAFALAIPAGVALAWFGGLSSHHDAASPAVGYALAFSAGVFLCISMSDLLPELQFHHHDRLKLSAALLLGLALAWLACRLETHSHATATAKAHTQAAVSLRL